MINGVPSPAEVEVARTSHGGWSKKLRQWGIEKPYKGWKADLAYRYFEQQLLIMTPEERAQVADNLDQIEAADDFIAEAKRLRLKHQQRLNAVLRKYDGTTAMKAAPSRPADVHDYDDVPWWSEEEWTAGKRGIARIMRTHSQAGIRDAG